MGLVKKSPKKPWRFKDEKFNQQILELSQVTGLSPLTIKICFARNLKTLEQITYFLSPRFDQMRDPESIADMRKAVERIAQAKQKKEKILIFGDYDVDGTCGAALLSWVFKELDVFFECEQPDRFKDGYGLNLSAVKRCNDRGIKVLVTVDCGITSFEAAKFAKENGIDLIIIDHHQVDVKNGLPPAYAVINPHRVDCPSGLRELCGCGLAFYFSIALRSFGKKVGWFSSVIEPNLKFHLDLVAIATAADQVPLIKDNRILVHHGLQTLKFSKKPGVKALLEVTKLSGKNLTPVHIGFTIGPRINASGRLKTANLALKLLCTEDSAQAKELARELESLNCERSEIQNRIWEEVKIRVERGISKGEFQHSVVVADSAWHEGVIGIVAARVCELFRRPAVVIAVREGIGKGSVRSYGGKDVLSALRHCSKDLIGYGGHYYAAGLTIDVNNIDQFVRNFDQTFKMIPDDPEFSSLLIEARCSIDELDLKTLHEIERLGPFGVGNPEPVFSLKAAAKTHRILKDKHLKLGLENQNKILEAVWFNSAESVDLSELRETGEWAGVPELNRFMGRVTPTLRVKDWQKIT